MGVEIKVKRLENGAGLPMPSYESAGAAGMDICAAEDSMIAPGKHAMIPTGLAFAIPQGFEVQVRPRSGLAAKKAVTVLNTPGTIDSDYRGEVKVILANFGEEDFAISRGDRIAQVVVAPVTQAVMAEVDDLDETKRGAGGFGSTGV